MPVSHNAVIKLRSLLVISFLAILLLTAARSYRAGRQSNQSGFAMLDCSIPGDELLCLEHRYPASREKLHPELDIKVWVSKPANR